jgi:hypothetical protein
MMNVDDSTRILFNKAWRQNLHVARQNDKVNVITLKQFDLAIFHLEFVCGEDWEMMKRNLVKAGEFLRVLMIADDQTNLAVQFTNLVAVQQVNQAMLMPRDKNGNLRRDI